MIPVFFFLIQEILEQGILDRTAMEQEILEQGILERAAIEQAVLK